MDDLSSLLSLRARGARSSVIRDLLKLVEQPGVRSLAGGLPSPQAFPYSTARDAAARILERDGAWGERALQYGPTEGVAVLRQQLADDLFAKDLRTTDAEVIVTTGSQQALDLIGRALVDPGDVVVVEAPTYLGALQSLSTWSPQFVTVPLDQDGMCTDDLEARLARGLRPKLCYLVSNFQNPSGVSLSLERRRHLAALADRFGFAIVDDDPYGALRFEGEPLPPLRAFTSHAITLGSASKVLAPGLRVGWAAGPAPIVAAMVRAKQAADLHTSTLSQAIVFELLADRKMFAAHVGSVVALYRERAEALGRSIEKRLGEVLSFREPAGGMFLWAELCDGANAAEVDTEALLPKAVECGVAFVPGTAFHLPESDLGHRHLRLSFATLTPEQLDDAIARLARAIVGASRPRRC